MLKYKYKHKCEVLTTTIKCTSKKVPLLSTSTKVIDPSLIRTWVIFCHIAWGYRIPADKDAVARFLNKRGGVVINILLHRYGENHSSVTGIAHVLAALVLIRCN